MAIPPKVKINLRMTEALKERVESMAEREQVSANTVMVRALENYLQWKESKPPTTVVRKLVTRAAAASPSEDRVPQPAGGPYAACPCGSGKKRKFCHGGKAK